MTAIRRTWGLPLLARELVEQAVRKRTYVIRCVYALLLFAVVLLMFWDVIYENLQNPFAVLGRGQDLFEMIVGLQLAGVYLFMPALACGVITAEKERNSLGLLLLTKLGPWTIVFEKYLARLIPMLSFLLLSLPLLAFAYALGGVSSSEIWLAAWMLLLTALQVGAFAVMCSCFFGTTAAAFVATYVLGFLFYFGPGFLLLVIEPWRSSAELTAEVIRDMLGTSSGVSSGWGIGPEHLAFPWVPPIQFFDYPVMPAWLVAIKSVPTLLSIALFLGLARVFLIRRAFVPGKNPLLAFFRSLDGFFHRLNQNRVTKGIEIYKESTTLPEFDPIAWRETRKKSLGTVRYLVRIFVALEGPILAVCLIIAIVEGGRGGAIDELSLVMCLLWILTALLLVVKGTSLIAGERTHETLDVLLTTPLSSKELVVQKMRGLSRLMIVLGICFATIIVFETWWRSHAMSSRRTEEGPVLYFISSTLAAGIFAPIVAWLSFYVGLRMKTQARAIFTTLAILVVWCAGPFLLAMPFLVMLSGGEEPFEYLMALSPAAMIGCTEFGELDSLGGSPWGTVLFVYVLYGFLLTTLRTQCLLHASRFLGRAEPP